MRIVHIIDSSGYYGAEVMLLTLCLAQQRAGIDIEVLSVGSPGNYDKAIELKLRENGIPCKIWRMAPWPDVRESRKMLSWCNSTKTDLIHSHGYKGNILLGLLPKSMRPIPVVSTMHGYTSKRGISPLTLKYWLDRRCLQRLEAVVLVSKGMKTQADFSSLKSNLHIIPNGIPATTPESYEEKPEDLQGSDPIIVSIGRFSKEKNFGMLISSMPLVLRHFPDARLIIYGDGIERELLEAQIEKLRLTEKVLLPGYIDKPCLVYREADIFVNCSLSEGMPVTLLEAMREGCPVVATGIPASRALYEGMGCAPPLIGFSADALAEAITDSLRLDGVEKKARRDCFRQHFQKHYTDEIMAKRYLSLYRHVLEQKSSSI